jgi:hypothetical protein
MIQPWHADREIERRKIKKKREKRKKRKAQISNSDASKNQSILHINNSKY